MRLPLIVASDLKCAVFHTSWFQIGSNCRRTVWSKAFPIAVSTDISPISNCRESGGRGVGRLGREEGEDGEVGEGEGGGVRMEEGWSACV